jgi:hypothetical protein
MAVNTGLMNQREIHHVFTAKNLRKFELSGVFNAFQASDFKTSTYSKIVD